MSIKSLICIIAAMLFSTISIAQDENSTATTKTEEKWNCEIAISTADSYKLAIIPIGSKLITSDTHQVFQVVEDDTNKLYDRQFNAYILPQAASGYITVWSFNGDGNASVNSLSFQPMIDGVKVNNYLALGDCYGQENLKNYLLQKWNAAYWNDPNNN